MQKKMTKLKRNFYNQKTIKVARAILGKFLVRKIGGKILAGKIVETEGYVGPRDRASHASRGKTARTTLMFGPPGYAYVYLVYGLNYCFNVVTECENYPAAVLIRAVEPVDGIDLMRRHRRVPEDDRNLTNGPGKLCQALKIDKKLNGADLAGNVLWIEDRGLKIKSSDVVSAKRIGVDYARQYKNKPWRFYLRGNPFVSKP